MTKKILIWGSIACAGALGIVATTASITPQEAAANPPPPMHPEDDGVYIPTNPPNAEKCKRANATDSKLMRENFCRTIPRSWPLVRSRCWGLAENGGQEWDNWCVGVDW